MQMKAASALLSYIASRTNNQLTLPAAMKAAGSYQMSTDLNGRWSQVIEFNYKEALRQARELEQISEELKKLVDRRLKNQQAELGVVWKGESAQVFQKKADELFDDIKKTAAKTQRIAHSVQTTAKSIKSAEELAEKIVRTVGGS